MGRPLDEITFTATRRQGAWDGSWVHSLFTTFTFLGSTPQPVGPENLQFLDEGARSSARFIIYVHDDQPELFLIGRESGEFAADTVEYNGANYLVTSDGDWHSMPLGYRAYVLLEFAADEEYPEP